MRTVTKKAKATRKRTAGKPSRPNKPKIALAKTKAATQKPGTSPLDRTKRALPQQECYRS